MDAARRAAEAAARLSYGRLVALLASRGGDIAAAEDALADAFAAALRTWPERGTPDSPEAWLLTAARRNLGHARARRATADAGVSTMILIDDERAAATPVPFGDERLKLMFVCTHPAITRDVQAPLMLQAVLGLDAGSIARCFLVKPATMAQQLVRAKTKIRDAGIAFAVPDGAMLAARTAAVLDAVYAAFGTGWEALDGGARAGLAEEAIWLGRLVAELMPAEPEAMGLLALMLHCEARRPARRDADGAFVPLDQQNAGHWNRSLATEAEALLRTAARHRTPGRFQIEAAIQSLHFQAGITDDCLGEACIRLYDRLVEIAPTTGAKVARAAAYGEAGHAGDGLAQLDSLGRAIDNYQSGWAARARLLWLDGQSAAAADAAERAAALTDDQAVRAFLRSGGLFSGARAPSA